MAQTTTPSRIARNWRAAAAELAHQRGAAAAQTDPRGLGWYYGDTEEISELVNGPDLTHRLWEEMDEICRVAYEQGIREVLA